MAKTLLSASQRQRCQTHAKQPAPTGSRAQALLALDGGASQAQAAEQAGLTLGQVRYCLRRFRAIGIALFDDAPASPALVPQSADKPAPQTSAKKKRSGDKKDNKKSAKKAAKKDKKSKKKDSTSGKKGGKSKSKDKKKKKKK